MRPKIAKTPDGIGLVSTRVAAECDSTIRSAKRSRAASTTFSARYNTLGCRPSCGSLCWLDGLTFPRIYCADHLCQRIVPIGTVSRVYVIVHRWLAGTRRRRRASSSERVSGWDSAPSEPTVSTPSELLAKYGVSRFASLSRPRVLATRSSRGNTGRTCTFSSSCTQTSRARSPHLAIHASAFPRSSCRPPHRVERRGSV